MQALLDRVEAAALGVLATYANVHRGSGHHSQVTTRLYERAREIVIEYLSLPTSDTATIFCAPRRAKRIAARLPPGSYQCVSSSELGLPFGIRALAVHRRALPKGMPFETGGGTARLIGPEWAIWNKAPDRFEAGTPAIVNIIAFARALQLQGRAPDGGCEPPSQATAGADDGAVPSWDTLSGAPLLEQLRQTLIGRGARVPTADGERAYVNLDNAASTPTFEPIWAAVRRAWRTPGPEQRAIVEQAKQVCADVLGAALDAHDVLFTSNTTEAINLVAESLGRTVSPALEPVVLNTFLEHNSNELPWRATPGLGLVRLAMDKEGFVDAGELEEQLRAYNHAGAHGKQRITLVAVNGASNVLGSYNDVATVARIAHAYGARVLVDAAQWVGHRQLDIAATGIDYLAFSGHKVYAPFGTGVLIARKGALGFTDAELAEIAASGEENIGGIAGLAQALTLLHRIGFATIQAEEQRLTRQALAGLAQLPRVRVYGMKSVDSPRLERRGGVIAFDQKGRFPGTVARTLVERGGIGVRYGCHCAHLAVKRIVGIPAWAERVQYLMARAMPRFSPPGVVRVSFGLATTEADVAAFLEQLGRPGKHRSTAALRRRIDDYVRTTSRQVLD